MLLRDAFLKQLKGKRQHPVRIQAGLKSLHLSDLPGNPWGLCFLILPNSISTVLGPRLLPLPFMSPRPAILLNEAAIIPTGATPLCGCNPYTSKPSHDNTTNAITWLGTCHLTPSPAQSQPVISKSKATETLSARQFFYPSFSTFPLPCFYKTIIMGNPTATTKTSSQLVTWIVH